MEAADYWMPVLPIQLDVNIGLVSRDAPEVLWAEPAPDGSGVTVAFSKYVDVETVTKDLFRTGLSSDSMAEAASVEPLSADAAADGSLAADGVSQKMLATQFFVAYDAATVSALAQGGEAVTNILFSYADKARSVTSYAGTHVVKGYVFNQTAEFVRTDLSGAKVTVAGQTYNGQALKPAAKVVLDGMTLTSGTDYTVAYKNNTKAGTATVTVTGKGLYTGTASATFAIAKAANPLTAAVKKASVSATYNASKAVATAANVTVSKAQGTVAYANASTDATAKKFTVNKTTGAVTVPKATKVGTYTVKVKATAAGGTNYASGSKTVSYKIAVGKAASTIKLAAQTKTYTGKAVVYSGKVTRTGSTGKVTYKYYSDAKCTKAVAAKNVKAAKVYYVKATVAANANYKAATSAAAKLTVAKAANPLKATTVKRTAKLATVKKKAVTVARPMSVSKAQGKLTYAKAGGSKCLTVNKSTGKVTVKKGTKKGTYSIKIKVTAAGNANYKAGSKTVTCKVVVK